MIRILEQVLFPGAPVLALLVGVIIGSFLWATACRWGIHRAFHLSERSRCPECGKQLRWFELIPVLSYVMQRGRCRHCRKAMGPAYIWAEVLVAFVFAAIVATFGVSLQTVGLVLIASVLMLLAFIDARTGYLPDALTIPTALCLATGLAYLGWMNSIEVSPFAFSAFNYWLWGGVVGTGFIGLLVALTSGKGMGLGDVKLMLPIGFSLGGPLTIVALGVAFIVGAAVGVALIATGRATRKTALPFGPFLVLGWFVAGIWGSTFLSLVLY
ncbi:MAG: prepilin peptidase [Patescibacteria group bacterium]|jgi:leader peptidase (prepilin peptidase)/N-methyltransferase